MSNSVTVTHLQHKVPIYHYFWSLPMDIFDNSSLEMSMEVGVVTGQLTLKKP